MTDPLEQLFRRERPAILATLARRLGDLDLAEDALQDALTRAAVRWPADGVPERPGAWLTTVAWRCALDRRRRPAAVSIEETAELATEDAAAPAVEDDGLALILACCHPALPADARIALTLRHVGGLDERAVAAALLVSPPAMTKRLVRARRRLRGSGISFAPPERQELGARLASARDVIASIHTEGHLASSDRNAIRPDLVAEALWLARCLHDLVPDDRETAGLLALILLSAARLPSRRDPDGGLVAFADQDPGAWDDDALDEARRLLARTGPGPLGTYQLQAAIAAVHTFAARDRRPVPWHHVARLYAVLAELSPSPVVEVNRAVAVGRAAGPRAGLAILDAAAGDRRLSEYMPFHAARADLLERAGDVPGARVAWAGAAATAVNPAQRAALARRAAISSGDRT